MNKKGQINMLFNPRSLVFIFGGAILGFILFETSKAALLGAIIGGVISFLK